MLGGAGTRRRYADAAPRPRLRTAAASHASRLHSAKPARNGHGTRLDSCSTSTVFTDRRSPLFIDSSSAAALTLSKPRRAMMRTYSHVTSQTCSSSCSSCQRPKDYGLWTMACLWPLASPIGPCSCPYSRPHPSPRACLFASPAPDACTSCPSPEARFLCQGS
jgi:hypothetical protein